LIFLCSRWLYSSIVNGKNWWKTTRGWKVYNYYFISGGKCIQIIYSWTFVSIGDGNHDAQGDAFTVPIDDESNVLRLENFKATNGPRLFCLSLNWWECISVCQWFIKLVLCPGWNHKELCPTGNAAPKKEIDDKMWHHVLILISDWGGIETILQQIFPVIIVGLLRFAFWGEFKIENFVHKNKQSLMLLVNWKVMKPQCCSQLTGSFSCWVLSFKLFQISTE